MPTTDYPNCTPCCDDGGITSSCFSGITIPDPLQVEFFDATGDAVCLEGVIRNIIYFLSSDTDQWNLNGSASDIYGTTDVPCSGDRYQIGINCYDGPGSTFCPSACAARFSIGFQVIDDPSTTLLDGGATGADSLSGTGSTFELVFVDVPLTVGTGTVSVRLTAP